MPVHGLASNNFHAFCRQDPKASWSGHRHGHWHRQPSQVPNLYDQLERLSRLLFPGHRRRRQAGAQAQVPQSMLLVADSIVSNTNMITSTSGDCVAIYMCVRARFVC